MLNAAPIQFKLALVFLVGPTPALLLCCLKQEGLEKPGILAGLCAVDNRLFACLIKAVRR